MIPRHFPSEKGRVNWRSPQQQKQGLNNNNDQRCCRCCCFSNPHLSGGGSEGRPAFHSAGVTIIRQECALFLSVSLCLLSCMIKCTFHLMNTKDFRAAPAMTFKHVHLEIVSALLLFVFLFFLFHVMVERYRPCGIATPSHVFPSRQRGGGKKREEQEKRRVRTELEAKT